MELIQTSRLLLVPATADTVSLEMAQHDRLARLLACHVPPSWPPMNVRDVLGMFESILRNHPEEVGWHAWYWIARDQADPILVGSGGFRGPPCEGRVEIGYGTLEIFFGRGYATEATGALVAHALEDPRVMEIVAECDASNLASKRVLEKCEFVEIHADARDETCRYRRERTRGASLCG
jgi:RimJ/RimL family protein N-acetyltransferase